jgi:hypothetical protein
MNASLRIGRLQTTCHVAGLRFAPAVRDRAERACRDHIPIALGGASRWLDCDDDSVWIVRRIDLSIVTRIDAAPDEIALSIARSLGRALAKALTDDGDGTNAIRFPSRAAYLSRFVIDVAGGVAWTRWYFAPLSGWRLLPASAVIRSALVKSPVAGLDALEALDDRELENVLRCLTVADERLVLSALAGVSTDATASDVPRNTATARHPSSVIARRPLVRYLRSGSPVAKPERHEGRARLQTAEDIPPNLPVEDCALTRFGGIALLLRDANALPWAAWTAGWPVPSDGVSPDACLKWLTLALCCGSARAEALLADDVWRDLLGIPQTLQLREVARWLRAVGKERRQSLAVSAAVDEVPRSERRWLAISRASGISRAWCPVLTSLARSVYSGFARRLPDFASSSVDYLWRNFLDIDAVVDREQDRVVVRCGRAPLHLVLALTGMTRGLVAGADFRGRPIVVFSRE